jgi:hypothetical protein
MDLSISCHLALDCALEEVGMLMVGGTGTTALRDFFFCGLGKRDVFHSLFRFIELDRDDPDPDPDPDPFALLDLVDWMSSTAFSDCFVSSSLEGLVGSNVDSVLTGAPGVSFSSSVGFVCGLFSGSVMNRWKSMDREWRDGLWIVFVVSTSVAYSYLVRVRVRVRVRCLVE